MLGHSFILGATFVLQSVAAGLTGTVSSADSGEPLAGAIVSLDDLNTATLTDAQGRYRFPAVPAGPQHLTVRALGHTARTLHVLVPSDGELEINVALRRIAVRLSTVEVRPRVELRDDADGRPARVGERSASAAAIRNHPLLAEPDALLALSGGDITARPESPSGVHIRGGESAHTAHLIDGIPVLSPYHTALTFSALNTDALERVALASPSPMTWFPDALSGAIDATTRTPAHFLQGQGGISSTHARVTLDGPVPGTGATALVSARRAFPGAIDQPDEASYLSGRASDVIARLEFPALAGSLTLIGYTANNRFRAAAIAGVTEPAPAGLLHNEFAWQSRTIGAVWRTQRDRIRLRAQAWRATSDADATWHPLDAATRLLAATRDDEGALAELVHDGDHSTSVLGTWLQQSRTRYTVDSTDALAGPRVAPPEYSTGARTPLAVLFGGHERRFSNAFTGGVGVSAAWAEGNIRFAPRLRATWLVAPTAMLSAVYANTRQFSQSLRNGESPVSTVFPPELSVGAAAPEVPVASSDEGIVALAWRPSAAFRVNVQTFVRSFGGLALVAPRSGHPFATDGVVPGSGTSTGAAIDATISAARYGIVASYGWQRVRLAFADTTYQPEYGVGHSAEAGVIVYPTPTLSLRVGATLVAGRRVSAASGPLEWESCNVLDRGCEFGGSPVYEPDALGRTGVPTYVRADAGLRKHWHVHLGGRDAQVAVYGTLSNVFGGRNVLTLARDPATGSPVQVRMRPFAPLLFGLDWRF